ncbi:HEAT repeat domain-containing protein, partial [Candidatus Roizmanbacteria bacterium]|nr:HEAT repeat domain-containing protein [Candidatus Roizmanbacteria bacterium]
MERVKMRTLAIIFNVNIIILFLQFLSIPLVYGEEIDGLIKKYRSGNITDRRVIIRSLKYENNESLFQFFAEAADDDDPIIRKHAFEGVGNFKGEPALRILKKSLTDRSPAVVINSIPLFKRFSSNESLPLLLQLLKNKNSSILSRTIDTLGDLGNKDTCFYIIGFLNDPDEHVRISSYLSTGKLLQKFGDMFVKGIDADYDKKIRHEAVKEAYRLIMIFAPSFKKTWTGGSKPVQKVSLWCLGIFADIFIDRLNTYLMFEEDKDMLDMAQKADKELAFMPPILAASLKKEGDESLRWHILSLLKKFKTGDAMPVFIKGLDDTSFLIRA